MMLGCRIVSQKNNDGVSSSFLQDLEASVSTEHRVAKKIAISVFLAEEH